MKLWPYERFDVTLDHPSDRFIEAMGPKLASNDLFVGFTEGDTFVVAPKGRKSSSGTFIFYGNVSDAEGKTRIDIQLKDPAFYYRLAGILAFPVIWLAALAYRTSRHLAPLPPPLMIMAVGSLIVAVCVVYGLIIRNYYRTYAYKDRLIETLQLVRG